MVARARALEHARCGGPGVGAVGMCFTGGFALAMMVDDEMVAPVLSQPSLPFPLGKKWKRDLGISDADLATVKARRGRAVPARAPLHGRQGRARRRASSDCATSSVTAFLPSRSTRRPATSSASGRAHSVLTEDLVDEPGHPTREALDRVLSFFGERLTPAERQ